MYEFHFRLYHDSACMHNYIIIVVLLSINVGINIKSLVFALARRSGKFLILERGKPYMLYSARAQAFIACCAQHTFCRRNKSYATLFRNISAMIGLITYALFLTFLVSKSNTEPRTASHTHRSIVFFPRGNM